MTFLLATLFAIGALEEPERHSASFTEQAIYFVGGQSLASLSQLSQCAGAICLIFPNGSRTGKECLFFSRLCDAAAHRLFARWFEEAPSLFFRHFPPSHTAWRGYKEALSHIPAEEREEQELLQFLERRYLAKGNGFIAAIADWVCPFFGISVQTHPATSSSYARDPGSHLSQTYRSRMERFKDLLPHPRAFPLILTRAEDISSYLPSCLKVARGEEAEAIVAKVSARLQMAEKVVLDLTEVIPIETTDWAALWESYRSSLMNAASLNAESLFCIQQVRRDRMGAIRILPLSEAQPETAHRYLLEWVSHFGLTANMVELDHGLLSSYAAVCKSSPIVDASKEEFLSFLDFVDPKGDFMIEAALRLLKGLFSSITEEAWASVSANKTKSALVQLALEQIEEQFFLLQQGLPFFETMSHLEEIHTHLSSLLEIFSPFTLSDFSAIYRDFAPVPTALQPLASYGLHMSGMSSLAGIFHALEKTLGRRLRVLYGENSYFESVHAAKWISDAVSVKEARGEDFREADLLIAQFHPVLQRDPYIFEYSVENISAALRKALELRRQTPLTLALDDTIDFIRSTQVFAILSEFQREIERGDLNVVCIRSPKFDLFGMDNYAGAPFFMIHSRNSKWSAFDLLASDPVLLTDSLSANWFCLAYRFALEEEELYRKRIFENTRALLEKTPSRLFEQNRPYRIIPFQSEAFPSFIDIRISGSLHKWRAAALVGWLLFTRSMEEKIPIFTRLSLGFYHPNFTVIFGEEDTTLRLTLGIDPKEIDLFAGCFEAIDALNFP